jgi:hypothetical protein
MTVGKKWGRQNISKNKLQNAARNFLMQKFIVTEDS